MRVAKKLGHIGRRKLSNVNVIGVYRHFQQSRYNQEMTIQRHKTKSDKTIEQKPTQHRKLKRRVTQTPPKYHW